MIRRSTVFVTLAIIAIASLFSPYGSPAAARDLTDLVSRSKPSVVALRVFDGFGREVGTGSGFFIDTNGLVVTNYHVIEDGARIEVVLSDKKTLNVVGTLAKDKTRDLAVVKVDTGGTVQPLVLADRDTVQEGQEIVVLGHPMGLTFSTSEGIVSALRADEELPKGVQGPVLQISAPISPGSSGSPVMNLEGQVVGVVVSQLVSGQNLNFAIPASSVHVLLAQVDASAAPNALAGGLGKVTQPSFLRNLVISLLFFAALYGGYRYLR